MELLVPKPIEFLTNRSRNVYQQGLALDDKVKKLKAQISQERKYKEKSDLRQQLIKIQNQKNANIKLTRKLIGLLKTDLEGSNERLIEEEKNYKKAATIFDRKNQKFLQGVNLYEEAKVRFSEDKANKKKIDYSIIRQIKKLEKKNESLLSQREVFEKKLLEANKKLAKVQEDQDFFQVETIDRIETDFQEFFLEVEKNNDFAEREHLQKTYNLLKKKADKKLQAFIKQIHNQKTLIEQFEIKINNLTLKISDNTNAIKKSQEENATILAYKDQLEKDKKIIGEGKIVEHDLTASKKLLDRLEKRWKKSLTYQEKINKNLDFLSTTIGVNLDLVNPVLARSTVTFNLLEKLLLKDWFFIIMVSLLGAGVVLGTYMYIEYGVGALNEIFVVAALSDGLKTGNYTAALAFASSFLIARVLEGPLVGILDVGGSILTGLGIGIPAVFLSTSSIAFMMHNPFYAFLIGLVGGAIIGLVVIIIRLLKPKKAVNLGTDIMIGAGNTTGKFLGPLVIISAAMFQPLVGIGAGIGAIFFLWMKKPIVGGAIIGAMLFGLVPAFI